jgi:predicted TIM-barrel fold metal-dependent hydrolase
MKLSKGEDTMNTNPRRIDVHHHILPPEFIKDLAIRKIDWTGTNSPVPEWHADMARGMMERNGISFALTSVCAELVWRGEIAPAIRWARHCNDFMARLVQDDPTHFGGFATLPLPNTEAACRELEYALDVLKLDGVILFSSVDDRYPGDPMFEELFQELNKRNAVVFIHPNTMPPGSDVPKLKFPYGLIEFVFDTTRCVTNLLYSGTLDRYPNIRYILSHAGGTVPYLAWRIANTPKVLPGDLYKNTPKGPLHYLQNLYYDTALSTSDSVMAALQQLVPRSHILFGSDFPMAPEMGTKIQTTDLENLKVIDDATRADIYRNNALALFPRLAK